MSWSADEQRQVGAVLRTFTEGDPSVLAQTHAELERLTGSWSAFPAVLAAVLAYGPDGACPLGPEAQHNAALTTIRQSAGIALQHVIDRATSLLQAQAQAGNGSGGPSLLVLQPPALEVPLLVALCDAHRHLQTAASVCIAKLLKHDRAHHRQQVGVSSSSPSSSSSSSQWPTTLLHRLGDLFASASAVAGAHVGVARCASIMIEDGLLEVSGGTGEAELRFSCAMFALLARVLAESDSFEARVVALEAVQRVSFSGCSIGLSDDDEDEDQQGLVVVGHSPNRSGRGDRSPTAADAYRAATQAEASLAATVVAQLPTIVHWAQQLYNSGQLPLADLLRALTAVLQALMAASQHWELVEDLAAAVLPTVLEWLCVFDGRQASEGGGVSASGLSMPSPSQLSSVHHAAAALRTTCIDFITELAQAADVAEHTAAITHQLYMACLLDPFTISECVLGADRHIPDEDHEVRFAIQTYARSREVEQRAAAEEAANGGNGSRDTDLLGEFHPDADGDEGDALDGAGEGDGSGVALSKSRQSALFCLSVLSVQLPEGFVYTVLDNAAPVVARHLALLAQGAAGDSAAQAAMAAEWPALEAALVLLPTVFDLTAFDLDCDDDVDEDGNGNGWGASPPNASATAAVSRVLAACCSLLGYNSLPTTAVEAMADGSTPSRAYPAAPVRGAALRLLKCLGELGMHASLLLHPLRLPDVVTGIALHATLVDVNKSVSAVAIRAAGSLVHLHCEVHGAEDAGGTLFDDDDDEDGEEEGAMTTDAMDGLFLSDGQMDNGKGVCRSTFLRFYGLAADLSSLPMRTRVLFMDMISDVATIECGRFPAEGCLFFAHSTAILAALVEQWPRLTQGRFDTFESLSMGLKVGELLHNFQPDDLCSECPPAVAQTLVNAVCLPVLRDTGLLAAAHVDDGLALETLAMAAEVVSALTDGCAPAVVVELFRATAVAATVADMVLPLIRSVAAGGALSSSAEDLCRSALGVLGSYCETAAEAEVHAVAEALMGAVAWVIRRDAHAVMARHSLATGPSAVVVRTTAGVASGEQRLTAFCPSRILGNSLWCAAQLLGRIATVEGLVAACPQTLPDAAAVADLIASVTALVRAGDEEEIMQLNSLYVLCRLAELLPAGADRATLPGGGSPNVPCALLVLDEFKVLAKVTDPKEQLEMGAALGHFVGASEAVQAAAHSWPGVRSALVSMAAALAPSLIKFSKAPPANSSAKHHDGNGGPPPRVTASGTDVRALAERTFLLWQPVVHACCAAGALSTAASPTTGLPMKEKERRAFCRLFGL